MLFSSSFSSVFAIGILAVPGTIASPLESGSSLNARQDASNNTLSDTYTGSTNFTNGTITDYSDALFSNGVPQDNCHGSWYCGYDPIFSGGVVHTDCIAAYEQFSDYKIYSRYTRYSTGHCSATLTCEPPQDFTGYGVRELFDHIYNNQTCKKCGEHYFNRKGFPENSCQVKLNYCHGSDCATKGDPPSDYPALSDSQLTLANAALAEANKTLVNGVVVNITDSSSSASAIKPSSTSVISVASLPASVQSGVYANGVMRPAYTGTVATS